MRKLLLSCMLAAGTMFAANAQQLITVQGDINANTNWSANNQYLLKGYVYVTSGNTLTIDAGTIIKGDKNTKGALIIERGAKIMAQGTANNPIVFTSNQPAGSRSYGDWGGVILCGKAPVNWNGGDQLVEGGPRSHYGGGATPDAHDNSGVMSYVRIEFPGIAFSPNNEVNGLSLCGVGDGTTLDHIQVSYSGDDSYEWFGGTVNAKYLIAHRGWDDDFDTDNGFSGMVQFGIGLRDPFAADQSGSKAFESDSYQSGTATGLADKNSATKCIFANMTLVGPVGSNPANANYDQEFVSGIQIRRGSALSCYNSIVLGWPAGILIDESSSSFGSTLANLQDSTSEFKNVIVAGTATSSFKKDLFYIKDGARSLTPTTTEGDTITPIVCLPTNSSAVTPFTPYAGPFAWFKAKNHNNKILYSNGASAQDGGVRLQAPFTLDQPNFAPTSTSLIAYNSKALPGYMTTGGADPFANGKVYPFDPAKAINTDTTNRFANYNAPSFAPDYSSSKIANSFFTPVSFVGAIGVLSQDNWTSGWSNFNPQFTDYSKTATGIFASEPDASISVGVAPNPTSGNMTVIYDLINGSDVNVAIYDLSGNKMADIYNGYAEAGNNRVSFNAANLLKGLYIVKISNGLTVKAIKVAVN